MLFISFHYCVVASSICCVQMFAPVYTPVSHKPTSWMSSKSMLLPFAALRPEEVRSTWRLYRGHLGYQRHSASCISRAHGYSRMDVVSLSARRCKRRATNKAFGVTTFRTSLRNMVSPLTLLTLTICFDQMNNQRSGRILGDYTFRKRGHYLPYDYSWVLSLYMYRFAVNVEKYILRKKSTKDRQGLPRRWSLFQKESIRGFIVLRLQHHNDRILQKSCCLRRLIFVPNVCFLQPDGEGTKAEFESIGL